MISNLIETIKNYLRNRKEQQSFKKKIEENGINDWIDKLYKLGFKDISFPILIVYDEWDGIHLMIVGDIREFAITNSIHYWPLDYDTKLLDCKGNLWNWKYDNINKTNLPGTMIKSLEIEEVKELVNQGIIGHKSENEIKSKLNDAINIDELLHKLSNYDL